jgi:hypothetical protein
MVGTRAHAGTSVVRRLSHHQREIIALAALGLFGVARFSALWIVIWHVLR